MGTEAIFLLCIASFCCSLVAASHGLARPHRNLLQLHHHVPATTAPGGLTIFDVTKFGAKPNAGDADTETAEDNTMAFMHAWIAACKNSTTPSKVVIPKERFVISQTVFGGPCTSPKPIIFEVLGTVVASTDLSEFPTPEWVAFEDVDGLVLTGTGTFDGQGAAAWEYNDCKKNPSCVSLPSSLQFSRVNNTVVRGITSINPKEFHYHLHQCNNFTAVNLNISAPKNSPNTDGMHIGTSNLVTVMDSIIATGDDCISVGQGATNINISGITCGPGHGISVGSLGKRPLDQSVVGVTVKNCTFIGTTNGARIKTYIGKNPGEAKNIVYEDLVMNNVQNPIIIDQSYGSRKVRAPSNSLWKISDVHFRRIKGTTISNIGVSLQCSTRNPCTVEVADVDLTLTGLHINKPFISSCSNAHASFSGLLKVPRCL